MGKKSILRSGIWVVTFAIFLSGCAGMMSKPTEKNFNDPEITLKHVEVHKYWGWWYFSAKVNPSMGKAGNYGAPLALAFIFKIKNPNKFAVMMEEMRFTVGIDEFDLDTVILQESVWVPANKTTELRAISVFDGRSALLSLMSAGGYRLKEKGWSPWHALETFWNGIPDFSFPVHARQGSAVFSADKIVKVVPFSATFP